jgi:uncharacterized protein YkwD
MNKIIFILMFLPILATAQANENAALEFQNTLRTYYYHDNLSFDNNLSLQATQWANHLAINNTFDFQSTSGENLFIISIDEYLPNNYNPYLDASIGWAIDTEDISSLNNILNPNYRYLGIGVAKTNSKIIVVAKFK